MTYPAIPDGVALTPPSYKAEIEQIKRGVDEATRRGVTVAAPPEVSVAVTVFASPFANYGGGYAAVAYQHIGTRVFLRGLLVAPAAVAGGAPMFTLPAGVRPTLTEVFVVVGYTSAGNSAVRVDILSSGVCTCYSALPAGAYISMSGVSFSTLA